MRKSRIINIGILFALIIISSLPSVIFGNAESISWPTENWTENTPEQQGMNSGEMSGMFDYIATNQLKIQSVLVVRNGYIVEDTYLELSKILDEKLYADKEHLYDQVRYRRLHHLWSSTKSVTSLLVGIAIDKGYIEDVNVKLFDVFPDKWKASYEASKKDITLKDLLTMSSGLQWDELTDAFSNWGPSGYTLSYIIDKPMVADPGEVFEYSTGNTQLISAIVQKKVGMLMSEFAWQNLFTPIGIKEDDLEWEDIEWEWADGTVDRITFGGFGIYTTPRVMGRLGLLCLNNGNWDGTQIVSEDWITAATQDYVEPEDYGYLFWLNEENNYYSFQGFLGQSIYIIPEYNLVVAFTSEDQSTAITDRYNEILEDFIIKAATTPIIIPGYNILAIMGILSVIIVFKVKKILKNS